MRVFITNKTNGVTYSYSSAESAAWALIGKENLENYKITKSQINTDGVLENREIKLFTNTNIIEIELDILRA